MLWVVVCAGGSGSRLGGTPKQYRLLAGRTILARSVEAMRAAGAAVVVVADDVDAARRAVQDVEIVPGGAERRDSVCAGLVAVPEDAEVIGVHDAVRPLATPALVHAGLRALGEGIDGAVPVVPLTDTVKRIDPDGIVTETVDRTTLVRVQTPQLFRAPALRSAHADHRGPATDDASMIEVLGGTIVTYPGDVRNMKITYEADLDLAEAILRD